MASYPTTPVVFPARSDGQTIFAQHVNALQDEVAALEASLIGGSVPTPLTVAGTRAEIILAGAGTAKGHLAMSTPAQMDVQFNARFDGTNWNADEVTQPSMGFTIYTNQIGVTASAVGANPRSNGIVSAFLADGSIRERARSVAIGEWIDVALVAANFTASVGTWTISTLTTNRYMLVGKTMFYQLHCAGLTSNAGVTLGVKIPGGFVAAKDIHNIISVNSAGWQVGMTTVGGGGTVINVYSTAGLAGFPAGSINVIFTACISLQ